MLVLQVENNVIKFENTSDVQTVHSSNVPVIIDSQSIKEELKEDTWRDTDIAGEQEVQSTNDDGYEGDMEGDGGLMPPPSTVPLVYSFPTYE